MPKWSLYGLPKYLLLLFLFCGISVLLYLKHWHVTQVGRPDDPSAHPSLHSIWNASALVTQPHSALQLKCRTCQWKWKMWNCTGWGRQRPPQSCLPPKRFQRAAWHNQTASVTSLQMLSQGHEGIWFPVFAQWNTLQDVLTSLQQCREADILKISFIFHLAQYDLQSYLVLSELPRFSKVIEDRTILPWPVLLLTPTLLYPKCIIGTVSLVRAGTRAHLLQGS